MTRRAEPAGGARASPSGTGNRAGSGQPRPGSRLREAESRAEEPGEETPRDFQKGDQLEDLLSGPGSDDSVREIILRGAGERGSCVDADIREFRAAVSKMTLDEKIHEMTGSGIRPMLLSQIFRQVSAPVYAGGNEGLGIPPVAFSDGPRGIGSGNSTSFPVSMARASGTAMGGWFSKVIPARPQ